MNQLQIVKAEGSHYDAGIAIGTQLQTKLVRLLQKNRELLASSYEESIFLSEAYLAATKKFYPEYIEEIRGIATGARVPFADLFLGNCTEVANLDRIMWENNHCTIAAIPYHGGYLIGHNEDAEAYTPEDLYILDATIDGVRLFGISYVDGIIGSSVAINGYGVLQAINSLPDSEGRIGVPRNIIARSVLDAKNINEVKWIMERYPRASGYNHVVCQKDLLMNIESNATDCIIEEIHASEFVHTNHYLTPLKHKTNEGSENYVLESKNRFNKALAKVSSARDAEGIKAVLSDQNDPPISKTYTIASAVFNTIEPTCYFHYGRPSLETYYKLEY